MTINTASVRIPAWTKGERLRKAREDAGMTQQQLADQISVSKRQIIKYEGNQKEPTRGHLLLWQMVTNVPAEWIETGTYGSGTHPDGGGAVTGL